MFDGKADVVDLVLRHFIYGACGLGTAHFDAAISCVQYAPAGDVIAAGDSDGRIHFICAQTGEKNLCPLRGHSKDKEECRASTMQAFSKLDMRRIPTAP